MAFVGAGKLWRHWLCRLEECNTMAVRTILCMGEPLLIKVAEPVSEFGMDELNQLIEDMFDTMTAAAGVGLAAPQIGVSRFFL